MTERTLVYLVRHGETEWNRQDRFQGQKNSPLTQTGKMQALEAGKSMDRHNIHVAYSSPLQRARQTMNIILEGWEINVVTSNDLREINLGPWEGKTKEEVKKSHPNEYDLYRNQPHNFFVPEAETFHQLQKRMVSELNAIFNREKNKTILIVSHSLAIKVALAYYASIPLKRLSILPTPGNGKCSTLIRKNERIMIDSRNNSTFAS